MRKEVLSRFPIKKAVSATYLKLRLQLVHIKGDFLRTHPKKIENQKWAGGFLSNLSKQIYAKAF